MSYTKLLLLFSLLTSLWADPNYPILIGETKEKDWTLDTLTPSVLPPKGLEVSEIPQFLLIGSDDNTKEEGLRWVSEMWRRKVNPTTEKPNPKTFDGDSINTSFYIQGSALEDSEIVAVVKDLYSRGFDIGNHSYTHTGSVIIDQKLGKLLARKTVEEYSEELLSCNTLLVQNVGMAPQDIKGFRAPCLEYNDTSMTVLEQMGFLYDCSILSGHEYWHGIGDVGTYYWPYTLEGGSPSCTKENYYTEHYDLPIGSHEGLWEIPVQLYQVPADSLCEEYGTKPGLQERIVSAVAWAMGDKIEAVDFNLWSLYKLNKEDCLAILKYTLDKSYYGNRAPLSYLIHSDYYGTDEYNTTTFPNISDVKERREVLEEFVDYTLSKKDVRIVSPVQLIEWMRNPEKLQNPDTPVMSNAKIAQKAITFRAHASGELQFAVEVAGEYSIAITNLQGRSIFSEKRSFVKGINNLSLKKSLGRFIYILSITTPEGAVYNTKLSF